MKYLFVISFLAAVVAATNPSFLNSDFDVKEGVSFTLKFNNCQGGCTIILQNGPPTNTQDVKTLTTSATGDSYTFIAKDIATGTYNFKIISNTDASAFNYSKQFAYSGTGTTRSSTSSPSSIDSTSAPSSASYTVSSTMSATASPTMISVTSSSSGSATSTLRSTNAHSAEKSTSTLPSTPTSTTIPNAAAGGRALSSLALMACVVVAIPCLG
ncbi:hypothetical protein E4U21_002217 [Claviceps maximensis]|nr:hypothetical protein E4U21_002217 [Claviceps maximensis]